VIISVFGTLAFGAFFPATQVLINRVVPAAQIETPTQRGTPTAALNPR
jgi:hypothetical protein